MVARFFTFLFSLSLFIAVIGLIIYYLIQWRAKTQFEKIKRFEHNEELKHYKNKSKIWEK